MTARRVALDIGTADPSTAREAAARVLTAHPALDLTVVGPTPDRPHGDRLHWRAAVAPSAEVDPAVAVRGRPDLSVRVALELGRDGAVDAIVSASPLAALLTGVRFLLQRRIGVRDPLVAVDLVTPAGDVTVVDVSGRGGTTATTLAGAAHDLGDLPDRVGLLSAAGGDDRSAAALAGQVGTDVRAVTPAEVLAGAVPVVLADGAAGALLVDTVRALAPDRVGTRRILGLTDTVGLFTVGPDPATWDDALGAAAGVAA